MASDPDETFFRNYFASYGAKPSSGLVQPKSMRDLEYCNCILKCCSRFSPKIRLQLRTWYQRLTPEGRTAFLSSHLREASPGHVKYRLPMTGTGDLVIVCKAHFMDTLQESNKDLVDEVISAKRKPVALEEDHEEDFEGFEEEEMLPDRHNETQQAARLDRIARGLSYTTFTYKLKPPRKVKAPCDSTCKFQCYQRFPLADRQQRLKMLLQMPLVKQRSFLSDLVCRISVMPPRKHAKRSRLHNYYFFREGRQLHKVCKTMFLNTYDTTRQQFSRVMKKKGSKGHVVCGNPEFVNVLKNLKTRRLVFDVDEGRTLEEFPVDLGSVQLEEVLLEDVYGGIKHELEEIKSEHDETDQAILPDDPPATDNHGYPHAFVKHEIEEDSIQDVELASVDIKSETDEPEADDQQLVESDISPGDSSTDSQLEVLSTEEEEELPAVYNLENLMRARKIRGLCYKTKSGNLWPARQVKPHCSSGCSMQCHTRVPDEVRKQLLADLLRLPLAKQKAFIGDHVCRISTISGSTKSSRRQCSNFYFLPVDFRLVRVCKTMFCNTYDITDKMTRLILLNKGSNAHVVCGNPNFPSILKKGDKGYYFDYNATCDNAEEKLCNCDYKCTSKFSNEVIEGIRSSFQKKSADDQLEFLSNFVQLMPGGKKVLLRARFFLPLEPSPKIEEVCRKMFLSTFQIHMSLLHVLLNQVKPAVDPFEQAKAHVASYRMNEEHRCEVAGAVRKLSRCPNPIRMYNEYLEGLDELGPEPIEYQQYYGMFSKRYTKMGLMLPARCADCRYFAREEGD